MKTRERNYEEDLSQLSQDMKTKKKTKRTKKEKDKGKINLDAGIFTYVYHLFNCICWCCKYQANVERHCLEIPDCILLFSFLSLLLSLQLIDEDVTGSSVILCCSNSDKKYYDKKFLTEFKTQ